MKLKMIIAGCGMLAMAGLLLVAGCSKETAEGKVKAQLKKIHALTPEERQLAETNAKQFFNKKFPVQSRKATGEIETTSEQGVWLECKPSDSNFNGLVTCYGKVPQLNGILKDETRYCGYSPELVGCSTEDTVK